MNYLAHFYLAYPHDELMFGNFIGDGVKGSDLMRFSEGIQRGIRFHRFIDSYTDSHPEVAEAKRLFQPFQGKYSPVVVDVMFDHLLATKWSDFHQLSLEQFAEMCYSLMAQKQAMMPERSARFYGYMVSNNLLINYGNRDGLDRVFQGMDNRARFASEMKATYDNFITVKDEFTSRFDAFFPDLIHHCELWKTQH